MNPEPITTRWMRGISWRMVREVIFGIGSGPASLVRSARQPARRSCATLAQRRAHVACAGRKRCGRAG
jgi:hypothetical protein